MNKQSNVNSTAVSTTTAVATSTATTAAVKLTKKEFSIQLKEMFLTVYQSTTKTTTDGTAATDGTSQWENDKWLINWLEDNNNTNQLKIEQLLQNYYHNEVATHMAALLSNLTTPTTTTTTSTNDNTNDNEIGLEKVLKLALEKLPIESRAKVLETLKKL